jgi:hypothetical protein
MRSGLSPSTPTEGWSQDVSEDIAHEVLDRAYDAVSAPMPKLPGLYPLPPACRNVIGR